MAKAKDPIKWNKVATNNYNQIKGTVVVTNNIDARDGNGDMTHIWLTNSFEVVDGKVCCWDLHGFDLIRNVTHYYPLPLPVSIK